MVRGHSYLLDEDGCATAPPHFLVSHSHVIELSNQELGGQQVNVPMAWPVFLKMLLFNVVSATLLYSRFSRVILIHRN